VEIIANPNSAAAAALRNAIPSVALTGVLTGVLTRALTGVLTRALTGVNPVAGANRFPAESADTVFL